MVTVGGDAAARDGVTGGGSTSTVDVDGTKSIVVLNTTNTGGKYPAKTFTFVYLLYYIQFTYVYMMTYKLVLYKRR